MKEIQLTKGKVALVDDEDYSFVARYHWSVRNANLTNYAQTSLRIANKQIVVQMHRFIMNPPAGLEVDHIDGNGLNNCKSNLRLATRAENARNLRNMKPNTTSGYRCVSRRWKSSKWVACITVNKKMIHLGYFDDKTDAAKAYNEAAKKYHGEFAVLNEI